MKKHIMIFLMFAGLAACQPETEDILPSHTQPPVAAGDTGDQIARQLSRQLTDPQVRAFIKKNLMIKFDGDYNFLLALHYREQASGTKSISELLQPEFGEGRLEDIIAADPLLQIAMPTLESFAAPDWNTELQIPLVVYRPPDADLSKISSLPAYRNGALEMLDITREPDEPILVLSHNERTVAVPADELPVDRRSLAAQDCSPSSVGSFGGLFYYLKDALEQCYGTEGLPQNPVEEEGCDRDRSAGKDHVIRAKFTTMNYMREAEHYLDGNPEVYFIVTLASKNPSGFASLRKSFPSTDRSQWKNCGIFSCVPEWHEKSQPVFIWDKEVFGDLVRYDWFEEDFSTAKIDITLGLTSKFENVSVSGNVKITISKKDYFLDQDFVYYCDEADGTGSDYNTGKLYFTVNNK